jgi:flagellar basal body P-ring formation protein FlgA
MKAAFAILLLCMPLDAASAAERAIPVPSRAIFPGDRIAGAALVEKPFNVPDAALRTYAIDRAQIEGMLARRMLPPGRPVPLSAVRPRDAVAMGEPARASFLAGGLAISTLLIPLQAGRAGDVIDARNPTSRVVVKARVQADGTLKVGP